MAPVIPNSRSKSAAPGSWLSVDFLELPETESLPFPSKVPRSLRSSKYRCPLHAQVLLRCFRCLTVSPVPPVVQVLSRGIFIYLHAFQIFPAIFSDKLRLGDPRVESAISQRPVLASQRPYRGNRRRVCFGFVCGLFTVCFRPWSPILFLRSIPSLTFLRFGSALLAQQFFLFLSTFFLYGKATGWCIASRSMCRANPFYTGWRSLSNYM